MDHVAVGCVLATTPARAIETFRPYLCVLARMHLDRRLWAKLDPEDLVQTTFQEAVEHWDRLRPGNGDLRSAEMAWSGDQAATELKAVLRQMLLHNLWDALRRF